MNFKVLPWFLGIVLVLWFVFQWSSSDSPSTSQNTVSSEIKWYQGGTLHSATVGEWRVATPRNRIATAADWTIGVIGQSEFERIGPVAFKAKAFELVKCIDGSTDGLGELKEMSAREIGAACITLMGWK